MGVGSKFFMSINRKSLLSESRLTGSNCTINSTIIHISPKLQVATISRHVKFKRNGHVCPGFLFIRTPCILWKSTANTKFICSWPYLLLQVDWLNSTTRLGQAPVPWNRHVQVRSRSRPPVTLCQTFWNNNQDGWLKSDACNVPMKIHPSHHCILFNTTLQVQVSCTYRTNPTRS